MAQIVENMSRLDDVEFKKLYGTDLTAENLIQAVESEMGILAVFFLLHYRTKYSHLTIEMIWNLVLHQERVVNIG